MRAVAVLIILCAAAAQANTPAGTFSIVAYDAETGELGIAVASRVLAVGYIVPWARAGVGAIATQSLANVSFGPEGLAKLAAGASARETLDALLAADDGREQRQAGIVDARGNVAAFTGKEALTWAGHLEGPGYACQGNILIGETVVREMARAYEEAKGPLARRLLAALAAGDAAGGDSRGKESAALLVVRAGGGYQGVDDRLVDIRVDDHSEPVAELARIYELWEYRFMLPVYLDAAGEREHAYALAIAERLLASKPDDAQTYNAVAWELATRKLYPEEALAAATRAHELAPEDAAIMDTLAETYYAAGDYKAAIDWERKALARDSKSAFYKEQLDKFKAARRASANK